MNPVDPVVPRRRFVLLTFLGWFPTGLLIPALVLLLTARGLSLQTIGLVFAGYGLACVVLELPTGGLADVIGRRTVLVASGILFVASALVLAVGQGVVVLAAGTLVAGIGRALDSGPLEAWYVDAVRAVDVRCDLKPGLSRGHAAGAMGLALGSLAGGGLIAGSPLPEEGSSLLLSLSVPYLVSAAVGVVGLWFVLAWVVEPDRPGPRPSVRDVLADVPRSVSRGASLVTRSWVLRRVSLRMVVAGVLLVTCELLSPVQFGESIGADGYAVLVTLAFVAAAAGARLGPLLARLVGGTGRGLLVATLVAGVALTGLTLPGWLLPAAAYVLVYLAAGLDDPLVGELLHEETTSEERATVLSVQSLLLQGGGAAANVAVPALVAATAFNVAWLGVAAMVAAGARAACRGAAPRRARRTGRAGRGGPSGRCTLGSLSMSIHLGAAPGEVAPHVLMPGDPLRAKWIAETFLEDVSCYTEVRGMLGFTGTYRGQRVSVQGSGMGLPSLSIYVNELFSEYDVQSVIRVGSCGALTEDLALRDVVIASGACTDSSMNRVRFEGLDYAPVADFGLLRAAYDAAAARGVNARVGLIFSSDSFYNPRPELVQRMADYGVLAVEMEASALYTLAAKFRRKALTICTVSDNIVTGEQTTAQEREQTFGGMVEIALSAALGES